MKVFLSSFFIAGALFFIGGIVGIPEAEASTCAGVSCGVCTESRDLTCADLGYWEKLWGSPEFSCSHEYGSMRINCSAPGGYYCAFIESSRAWGCGTSSMNKGDGYGQYLTGRAIDAWNANNPNDKYGKGTSERERFLQDRNFGTCQWDPNAVNNEGRHICSNNPPCDFKKRE